MRKYYLAMIITLAGACVHSQQLSQVTFAAAANLSYYTFSTHDVMVRVTPEGQITEWGTELQSMRSSNYYAPRLQPYMGRVEYYGAETDSIFRGKVKSIGTTSFTYYGAHEEETKKGKLKSLGILNIDYYNKFGNKDLTGKIRFAGNLEVDYYTSIEDEGYRGKPRSIGNTLIMYHSSFDDKLIRGKIKSIGPMKYTWYTSLENKWSGLKSGSYRASIGGITYILQ